MTRTAWILMAILVCMGNAAVIFFCPDYCHTPSVAISSLLAFICGSEAANP